MQDLLVWEGECASVIAAVDLELIQCRRTQAI